MVQNDFIEHSSGWLPALVLVNFFWTQFLQCQGVSDRFTCGLDGELVLNIADGKSLTIYSTYGNTPFFFWNSF